MVLNKLPKKLKNFINRKSVIKSWLIGYVALIIGMLLLILWAETIFFNVIVENTITKKTEEVNTFSNKMDMLTEECRMYALKLTTDELFTDNFLKIPRSVEEHYELGKTATRLRREKNLVNEFFVYIKSENAIINSLGNVTTPEHYYDIFYKNSGMSYEVWFNEFLNRQYSGYHIFDNNAEKKVERMAKFCYVLPFNILYSKDNITIFTEIDSSRYESELEKLGEGDQMSILIYDENGNRYFSMGEKIPAEEQLKEGKFVAGFYETKIDKEKVVMYVKSSAFATWKYAFVIPYSVFWFELTQVKYIGFAIFFLIAVMGIVGIYLLTKYNYKAVANIVKRIKTNFATKDNDDENEYVQINKMIDIASQYGKRMEAHQKKERINYIKSLFLGDTDINAVDNMLFETDTFVTVALFAPNYEKLFSGEQITDREKAESLRLIVTNIFSELMESYGNVDVVEIDNINFLLTIRDEYAASAEKIVVDKIEEMRNLILQHFEMDIICGVSRCVKGISNICISYREAQSALNSISHNSELRVVIYTQKGILQKNYYYPVDQMQYLMMLISQGDRENAFRQIEIIFEINSAVFDVANLTKAIITDIAATIMKAALNVGYKIDAEKLMGRVQSLNRIAAEKTFRVYINDICDFVESADTGREKTIVEKIDAIIEENYTDPDFNVNKIADMLNVRANSLSVSYRRKKNTNISENIQHRRVNEAKRLLTEESDAVDIVAQKSGFANNSTFRRVFKAATGVSASVYREMNKKN